MADTMEFDVLIAGAGPAGLAAAIRLKQQAAASGRELSVCVLEKAAAIGGHIVSGAVIDPRALDELLPDWREHAPFFSELTEERFLVLGRRRSWRLPTALLPPLMHNRGSYIVSLGQVCQWLAEQAEALGVEIYPGFAGARVVYDEQGRVRGVATGDMGVGRDGQPRADYSEGMELHAAYTLFAEGVRGSLTRELEQRFDLRAGCESQHYGLGIKEVWRVKPENWQRGLAMHTLGWPLDQHTGGGGFIYHQAENQIAIGFVVHLNYRNPYLSPFEEFQRFKTHPAIRPLLEGGERLAYGARAISEGGLQSLPRLVFPGGALIGCSAGVINVPRIKGVHNAMKTGMLAAEAAFAAIADGRRADELEDYPSALRRSWVWQDLDAVRNVKPALSRWGTWLGMAWAGVEMWLAGLGVRLPWTLRHGKADHESLLPAHSVTPVPYDKPDGRITFDRLSSLALSSIDHPEDQPNHLHLLDQDLPIRINLARYDAPEQRYCPAGVYEIVTIDQQPALQINGANCVHCKTCDIKDPQQNIVWTPPQGGSGPCYSGM